MRAVDAPTRAPSGVIATAAYVALACVALACSRDAKRDAKRDAERDATGERARDAGTDGASVAARFSAPARGVERAFLLDSTHVMVQASEGDPLVVYRRRDGKRVTLIPEGSAGGLRRGVAWSEVLPDGTIAAHSSGAVTVFDTTGRVLRTTALDAPRYTPVPVAAFANGAMIVLRDWMPSPYAQITGPYADTSELMPVDRELKPTGPEVPVTTGLRIGALDDPRPSNDERTSARLAAVKFGVFDGKGRHSIAVPLSPKMATAATTDGVYLGNSGSPEIRFLDPTGREVARFRLVDSSRALDSATAAAARGSAKDAMGFPARAMAHTAPLPARLPYYRGLLADRAGRVWVLRYTVDEDAPQVWSVYTRAGRRVGSLTLPAGRSLLDVGGREMLVVRRTGADRIEVTALPAELQASR